MKNSTKNTLINIAIAVVFVIIVAVVSSIFTNASGPCYTTLAKPSEYPPNWIFPLTWSTIYVLFAIVIYLLLKNKQMNKKLIIVFSLNGLFQILWCLFYFTLEMLFLPLLIILATLTASLILIFKLKKINILYFYLLLIYPIWLSIASLLNIATWILN